MLEVRKDETEKRQFDGLALRNKRPGFVYRWSRRDDFQVALNRFNGYEIVSRGEDQVESVLSSGTRMKKGDDVDDTIQLGDLILMSIPEERYEDRRSREEGLAVARQVAITKSYHSEIARAAGQTGVSYEAGHFVGSGRTGQSTAEEQRSSAADRASKREKMRESVGEEDYDRIMQAVEAAREVKP